MTNERPEAEPKTASPESAEPFYLFDLGLPDFTARVGTPPACLDYGPVMLAFVSGNFSAAFVQALGQRAADGTVKRVGDLVRTHVRRKGEFEGYHIGVDDGSAVIIAISADTPDEARLALLDLDVTADELRGGLLRWDSSASAWRPAGESKPAWLSSTRRA